MESVTVRYVDFGPDDDYDLPQISTSKPHILRPDQQTAIVDLRNFLKSGQIRPVLQIPTGGGKTLVACEIIKRALERGKRVIFTVPVISLIDQTIQKLWQHGVRDVGVLQSDHPMTAPWKPIQVVSLQTLKNRSIPEADVVIVDECHIKDDFLIGWMLKEEWLTVPFIGLSATPWAKGMARQWSNLIVANTTKKMIQEGHLSKFLVYAPTHVDLSTVKMKTSSYEWGTDYQEKSLAEAFDKPKLVADVVQTWIDRAEGRPTLVFGVDRAHAKHLQERFLEKGVSAAYVDCKTSREERGRIGRGLESGEYKVVCNVRTQTTGVDLDVRCIVLAMSTKSEILITQIIGRGLRTAPGKDYCLILDHGNTHLELGFVTDIHHDTLDTGKPRAKKLTKKPLPKECPNCQFLMKPGTAVCPSCGFVRRVSSDVLVAEGQLIELRPDGKRGTGTTVGGPKNHVWIKDQWKPMGDVYGELLEYAHEFSYKEGWAANKFRDLCGVWPNSYRDVSRKTVSVVLRSWIRHTQIAYAKAREKAAS